MQPVFANMCCIWFQTTEGPWGNKQKLSFAVVLHNTAFVLCEKPQIFMQQNIAHFIVKSRDDLLKQEKQQWLAVK